MRSLKQDLLLMGIPTVITASSDITCSLVIEIVEYIRAIILIFFVAVVSKTINNLVHNINNCKKKTLHNPQISTSLLYQHIKLQKYHIMKEESLYDLIKLTLLGSELTYAVSLMRELGRRELLGDDSKAALQLPMNAKEFQRIIKAHPDLAAVFEGQNEDATLQFSAVDHAVERNTVVPNTTRRFEKDTRGSMRIFQEEVGTTSNDNNDGHTLTDATSDELRIRVVKLFTSKIKLNWDIENRLKWSLQLLLILLKNE